jgi:NTP pyrophosphatase (non-canonical NTP hydrolase)
VRGTASTVDHQQLADYFTKNWSTRPVGLDQWQQMFQDIYPRSVTDLGRSTVGLLEELGELAEAVRVFEQHPMYFLGEAADTFSYLMGIANEHAVRIAQDSDDEFLFEAEFIKRYPGLCTQCGSKVCTCPGVPDATIGRMAKELDSSGA